jgi:hypothetical protein
MKIQNTTANSHFHRLEPNKTQSSAAPPEKGAGGWSAVGPKHHTNRNPQLGLRAEISKGSTPSKAAPLSSPARFKQATGGYRIANPPLAAGGKPLDGATHVYNRLPDRNSRQSPVDVEFFAYDSQGRAIHQRPDVQKQLEGVRKDIYGWDPKAWEGALAKQGVPQAAVQDALRAKAGLFWESLAQHFAEEALGVPAGSRKQPVDPTRAARTTPIGGVNAAEKIEIKFRLDRQRDPLMPVTREIFVSFSKADFKQPEVRMKVEVPPQLLPRFTEGAQPKSIELFMKAKPGTKQVNSDYPDFNSVFIPMQHLMLQGGQPGEIPAANLQYKNAADFAQKSAQFIESLNTPEGAQRVRTELQPFMNSTHYPSFGANLGSYKDYVLGPSGVASAGKRLEGFVLRIDGVEYDLAALQAAQRQPKS